MNNEANESTPSVVKIPNVITWRYQGDRTSADSAYCAHFNVQLAPEPMALADSVWAYTLPD